MKTFQEYLRTPEFQAGWLDRPRPVDAREFLDRILRTGGSLDTLRALKCWSRLRYPEWFESGCIPAADETLARVWAAYLRWAEQ